MTPLQKVAMGLVVVVLTARFGGYDALADPVGWALVLAGVWPLRRRLPSGDVLVWLAGVALLVSIPLVLPRVDRGLSLSGEWAASLPQTAFCLALSAAVAVRAADAEDKKARAFRVLRTAFVVVAIGPVLVFGGGVEELRTPVAVLSVAANVALIWCLFAVSRREWTSAVEESPLSPRPR